MKIFPIDDAVVQPVRDDQGADSAAGPYIANY